MSYIEDNLMKGEKVLYRERLHWIVFFWPLLWLFFTVSMLSDESRDENEMAIGIFVWVTAMSGTLSLINYITSEFGITNKRVIAKTGFIRRKSLEVLIGKVEGIQVDQGIFGRIVGYGSVTISGTGGTKDPFHKIAAPLKFRRRVQEIIDRIAKT